MHHPIQMKPADSENRNGKFETLCGFCIISTGAVVIRNYEHVDSVLIRWLVVMVRKIERGSKGVHEVWLWWVLSELETQKLIKPAKIFMQKKISHFN